MLSESPDLPRELVLLEPLPPETLPLPPPCRDRCRLRLLGLAADKDALFSAPSVASAAPPLPVADVPGFKDVEEGIDFDSLEDRDRDDFSAADETPPSSSEAMPASSRLRLRDDDDDDDDEADIVPFEGLLADAGVNGGGLRDFAVGVRGRVCDCSSDPDGESSTDFLVLLVECVCVSSSSVPTVVWDGVFGEGMPSLTDSSNTRRRVSS